MVHMTAVEHVYLSVCLVCIVAYGAFFIPSLVKCILDILPIFVQFLFFILGFASFLFFFSFLLEILSHVWYVAFQQLLCVFDALVNSYNGIHDFLAFFSHVIKIPFPNATQLKTNEFLPQTWVPRLIRSIFQALVEMIPCQETLDQGLKSDDTFHEISLLAFDISLLVIVFLSADRTGFIMALSSHEFLKAFEAFLMEYM